MRNSTLSAAAGFVTALLLAGCGSVSNGAQASIPQISAHVTRGATSNFKTLHRFLGSPADGSTPGASLVELGGKLYGTTQIGGGALGGVVFGITKAGAENIVYAFKKASDGGHPEANMIVVDGRLYGTTYDGGGETRGTVFRVTTEGVEELLHEFLDHGKYGGDPSASLLSVGGVFYSTTQVGGQYDGGTVFTLAPNTSNEYTVLHNFGGPGDGRQPAAPLIKVGNALYGTTAGGGAYTSCDCGTVYSITPNGTEKVLHSFGSGADGQSPTVGLTNVGGLLYGTTLSGGNAGKGTVFSITTSGTEKVVYSFKGLADGGSPGGRLIDVDGTLYGTTSNGGDSSCHTDFNDGCGTIFSLTPSGKETVLYSFTGGADGEEPTAGLLYDQGVLYGTTRYGGGVKCRQAQGCGTVFALKL